MAINIPVLLMTLGYIEENPHTWSQGYWRSLPSTPEGAVAIQEATRCGANLCFAGHAAMLTGAKWQVDKKDLLELVKTGRAVSEDKMPYDFSRALSLVKIPKKFEKEHADTLREIREDQEHLDEDEGISHPLTGKAMKGYTAGGYARAVLGLSEDQASALFEAENSLDDLRVIVMTLVRHQMEQDNTWRNLDYLVDF